MTLNAAQYSQPCYVVLTCVVPNLHRMPPDSVCSQARKLVRTVQCWRRVRFAEIPRSGSHPQPSCWNSEAKTSWKKHRNLTLNLRRGPCRLQCWLRGWDWLQLDQGVWRQWFERAANRATPGIMGCLLAMMRYWSFCLSSRQCSVF